MKKNSNEKRQEAMHRPQSSLILVLKFTQFVWVAKIVHELTSSCTSTCMENFVEILILVRCIA
jgi:hypothetical protein